MSREVEVYNAYFGDCIVLKDISDNTNLLIDFGIHLQSDVSNIYGNRQRLTEDIANDLAGKYSSCNANLLITHFHEDHVSGLVYMYQSGDTKFSKLFNTVYIANIWNDPFAVASNILEEFVLINQLKSSGLPNAKASLLDVLNFVSSGASNVTLLSRGVEFENGKYIALWPPKDISSDDINYIINELGLSESFRKRILDFSEKICLYVRTVILKTDGGNAGEGNNTEIGISMEDLKSEYESLSQETMGIIDNRDRDEQINVQMNKLNKLNHKYNIVFQNVDSGDENVLFTGDAEKEQMEAISTADDYKLHSRYKFIKIPHHGTEKHYFDFSPYNPEKIIITNGMVNYKNYSAYGICTDYGKIIAKHICTNSNNCHNCVGTCRISICNTYGCRILIFNRLSKVIR